MHTDRVFRLSSLGGGGWGMDLPGGGGGMQTPPIVDRMTNACENITSPHTTYAVGKKWDM